MVRSRQASAKTPHFFRIVRPHGKASRWRLLLEVLVLELRGHALEHEDRVDLVPVQLLELAVDRLEPRGSPVLARGALPSYTASEVTAQAKLQRKRSYSAKNTLRPT